MWENAVYHGCCGYTMSVHVMYDTRNWFCMCSIIHKSYKDPFQIITYATLWSCATETLLGFTYCINNIEMFDNILPAVHCAVCIVWAGTSRHCIQWYSSGLLWFSSHTTNKLAICINSRGWLSAARPAEVCCRCLGGAIDMLFTSPFNTKPEISIW